MKKFTLIALIAAIGATSIFAQAPQSFRYQAVVRDNSGDVMVDQSVSFRVSIIQDSINGTIIYSETHNTLTNPFGMAVLRIGEGTVESGIFEDLNWGASSHFLKLELDETGGANYQFMGTSELLSVPYALQAENVSNDNDKQTFSVSGDTLFISNGNYVLLPGVLPTIPFNTCGEVLTDNDGNTYNTVQIGTQCWMQENLNIGTMITGSSNQSNNATIEKYCYNNSTANCDIYGGLYQWDEMMDYITTEGTQGICPDGWHLPSDAEWMILEEEVESTTGINWNTVGWRGTDAGGNLKEVGTSHWISPNTGASNSSGFTGLPGGYRNADGSFGSIADHAIFWSSSEGGTSAWNRLLGFDDAKVGRDGSDRTYGFSVRCVWD